MKFDFANILSCILSYACIPSYMHKTLSKLVNEKEQQQIEFYKKLSDKLIFLQGLTISKCYISPLIVIVKHVQSIGVVTAFCLPGGDLLRFSVLGGQKKLLGCGLLGGDRSTQGGTMTRLNLVQPVQDGFDKSGFIITF